MTVYLNRHGEFAYSDNPPPFCENGINAHLGRPIFSPACYRQTEATQVVTIGYINCIGDVFEQDTLYLCDECAKLARKAARRDGYKFRSRRL